MGDLKKIFSKIEKSNILTFDEVETLKTALNLEGDDLKHETATEKTNTMGVTASPTNLIKKMVSTEKLISNFNEDNDNIVEENDKKDDLDSLKRRLSFKSEPQTSNIEKKSSKTSCFTAKRSGKCLTTNNKTVISARNITFLYDEEIEESKVFELGQKKNKNFVNYGRGVFGLHGKKMKLSSAKVYKVGDSVPEIRSYSFDDAIEFRKGFENAEGDAVFNFLKNPSFLEKNVLEEKIREALYGIKILYYSEFTLSCILFGFVRSWGIRNNWKNTRIFSLDGKMDIYNVSENTKSCFRCDFVLFHEDKMFVFEYKFVHKRPQNMGEYGLEFIRIKGYIKKSVEFMFVNYPEEIKEIKSVYGVGVGFSNYKGIKVDIAFKDYGIPKKSDDVEEKIKYLEKKRGKDGGE